MERRLAKSGKRHQIATEILESPRQECDPILEADFRCLLVSEVSQTRPQMRVTGTTTEAAVPVSVPRATVQEETGASLLNAYGPRSRLVLRHELHGPTMADTSVEKALPAATPVASASVETAPIPLAAAAPAAPPSATIASAATRTAFP
jgi:hypothetical protein